MAALWKLPVIYVCENNLYGEYTPCGETVAGEILDPARAFGIHAESVDGQDVQAVKSTMRRLVERRAAVRGRRSSSARPTATTATTSATSTAIPREGGGGVDEPARPAPDPGRSADRPGARRPGVFERIVSDVKAEIDTACSSRWRRPSPDERGRPACLRLTWDRGPRDDVRGGGQGGTRRGDAARPAGVPDRRGRRRGGHPLQGLSGLVQEFGPERVIDTPISEAGISGIGVGPR